MSLLLSSCLGGQPAPGDLPDVREPCAARNPLRNAYFGDLHVHTRYSFDASLINGLGQYRQGPREAYAFARGAVATLPSLDSAGPAGQAGGTRRIPAIRPLDFAAVTDHSEYLGEVDICTDPASAGYGSDTCAAYRNDDMHSFYLFGIKLVAPGSGRFDFCGNDGAGCTDVAGKVWQDIQQAAEDAYDRTAACSFTSFVAYEWTNNTEGNNLHRNVIFANRSVPALPITYYEADRVQDLWGQLRTMCLDGGKGCDVLAIPHNSNASNGQMFDLSSITANPDPAAARAEAGFRAQMEPLAEIYQHKGESECQTSINTDDPLCDFEKMEGPVCDGRNGPACTPTRTSGCCLPACPPGQKGSWCLEDLNFVRNALKAGLLAEDNPAIGVNPLKLGFIGSTDTHNGTPGATEEYDWQGHLGGTDDDPQDRLGGGPYILLFGPPSTFGPGGLAGVWAEENSRPSLFAALRRRETYATSGTRIKVRFFGGFALPLDLCTRSDMVQIGYVQGVPMGGDLPPPSGAGATGAPRFVVSAMADPGTADHPGTPLQHVQIIKGWVDRGLARERVYEIAGDPHNGAGVDTSSCKTSGPGAQILCGVFSDPDFLPSQRAFYYARVLEDPTCRWSARDCNSFPPDRLPAKCTDPGTPKTIQERAWTSPIWYRPGN